VLQIEKTRWRDTLAGCSVTVHEFFGRMVIRYGPHEVARFDPAILPPAQPKRRGSGRPLGHN